MRLPRSAVALLTLGVLTVPLVAGTHGDLGLPLAAGLSARSSTQADPALEAAVDPALAARPSRALAAAMPAGVSASTTAGTVRLTADPVTGRLCLQTLGITARPGTISGLSLEAPDGSKTTLSGDSLGGCSSIAPSAAAALLAAPSTFALVLDSAQGDLATAPLAAAAAKGRPWSVGTRTETIVDKTRGTAARGVVPAKSSRTIRVSYYYPAGVSGSGAAPSLEGPFPVILFEPGYDVTPATYARTLRAWAAAGYLVAGILSPGSGGGLPGTATEADLTSQPGDMSLVLTTIAKHTADPSSWLGGLADLTRVAVTGHSDGGSTAAAAGLLQRYTDRRYDAVIVMAGASFGGAKARKALPLLLLSGQDDEYNAPSTFQHVFNLGRSTRTWVQAIGARHLPPFAVAGRQADDLRQLEIAFLDRSLFGANTRATERRLASVRGVTRVAAGGF